LAGPIQVIDIFIVLYGSLSQRHGVS